MVSVKSDLANSASHNLQVGERVREYRARKCAEQPSTSTAPPPMSSQRSQTRSITNQRPSTSSARGSSAVLLALLDRNQEDKDKENKGFKLANSFFFQTFQKMN
jgi:hypothetical protein